MYFFISKIGGIQSSNIKRNTMTKSTTPKISLEMLRLELSHYCPLTWKRARATQLQDYCSVPIIIWEVHMIIKSNKSRMKNSFTRQRYKSHSQMYQNQEKHSHQTIKHIMSKGSRINKRTRTHSIVQKQQKSGVIITQIRKDIMVHSQNSQSILRKERSQKKSPRNKRFGSNYIFIK